MLRNSPAKRRTVVVCLLAAPLFQLVGDSLWVSHQFAYSWSVWREASYLFFIPVGFLLGRLLEAKHPGWSIVACGLYVAGCLGAVAMMPLFRMGAFYPVHEYHEFPGLVQSVLGQKGFAFTLFVPGLCLPVSLVVFGFCFLRYKVLSSLHALAFVLAGILYWLGNAVELDAVLITGDLFLLILFAGTAQYLRKGGIQAIHHSTRQLRTA